MCDYTDDFEENVNDEDVEKPEDFSGKNSYECLESDETYKGGLEKQNLDICDDMQESLEDINDYLENCEEVDLDSEIELEIDDIEMANLEEIQDILPDLDENLEKDQLDFSNKEKISKIDCDKLIPKQLILQEDPLLELIVLYHKYLHFVQLNYATAIHLHFEGFPLSLYYNFAALSHL